MTALISMHTRTHARTHTHTHTTVLWLSGLCPGQPGSAGTRRNIHPLTPIVVISHPLPASSIIQLLQSMASSLFNLRARQCFSTISLQVFFGLPLGLSLSLLSLQSSAVEHVLDILMDMLSWEIAKVVSPCLTCGL